MSISDELKNFGTTEVIVTLKEVPPGDGAALAAKKPELKDVLKHFQASKESRQGAVAMALGGKRGRKAPPYRVYPNLGVVLGTVDSKAYQDIKRHPAVAAVTATPQISLIRPVSVAAATATKGITWGIERLRAHELWDLGLTGEGVLVGHLDTGVDDKHPSLKGAVAAFAEFDELGDRVRNAKAHDSDNHGTHTAGTIAGRAVAGSRFGVAPGARLASAMVIEGGDIVARILGGLDWVIGEGVKILSMSLGLRGFRGEFLPLMRAVRNRGVLPIIAVGNEGPGTSRSPGNYAIVVSVGASDASDDVADFSSSQSLLKPVERRVPDLVAPGSDVLSAVPDGEFARMDGSSMATPHVAGLAALLWQDQPNATVDQIEAAILESCLRPRSMSLERANRGVPDAVKALGHLRRAVGAAAAPRRPKARRGSKKAPTKRK